MESADDRWPEGAPTVVEVGLIVRQHPTPPCTEKPEVRTAVRTIAVRANPYDAAHATSSGGPSMDLKLKPFDFAQAVAKAGLAQDGTPLSRSRAVAPATEQGGFQTAMTQAMRSVSDGQLETQRLQRELQLDNPTVSLEETMVAMQKSQLGFQAVLTVRNRMVQAYTDVMNMQV